VCDTMLFPVRVDAWSADRTIRIVDTFLYDPSAPTPAVAGLQEDPFRLAYQLLADAEVMGMGRSGRHYTNRVELYRPDLHHEITRQIRAQMESAKEQQRKQLDSAEAQQSAIASRRKRRVRAAAIEELLNASKKSKAEKEDPVAKTGDATTEANVAKKPDELPKDASSSVNESSTSTGEILPGPAAKSELIVPKLASKVEVASACRHVRLRLAAYGVRIHDDFFLDAGHEENADGMGPIRIARQLGRDLKLPVELVQAIAMEIHEQLHGRSVHDDALMLAGGDDGQPPPEVLRDKDNVTAAWVLDQRVHITNVAHLVSYHRPNAPAS
jgi:SNF5 / SMARCB1 / INI1